MDFKKPECVIQPINRKQKQEVFYFQPEKKDELNQTKNQTKKRNQIFYKCKSSMRKLISYVYTQKYTKIPKFTRFGNRHFSQTNELPTNQKKKLGPRHGVNIQEFGIIQNDNENKKKSK